MNMSEKILIVDDEPEIADLVSLYLQNENFTVYKFYSAIEALNCIGHEKLDMAILDVMMPEMNGLEASMAIREMGMDYTDNIPIIAMTANAFTEDVKKCFEAKMSDHISKPIDIDKVTNAIYRLVHKSDGI